VVSRPESNRLTTDLGHKSIASENSLDKRVHWLNASGLTPVGHSEEHFFFTTTETDAFQIGDLLVGLPWHICPTVALYEKAFTVEEGKISGEWKTLARDRKLTL
jgi:D-serine deaminase-like pyridoxal phosphate-dependent protein